jgi:hypothetical protein
LTRTVTGFKNGDSESTVSVGTTIYTVPNYQMGKPGKYNIVPSGTPAPANYSIVHANGILYVNDDKAKRITTALKCVEVLNPAVNGFGYRAKFTWTNTNNTDVYVPIGDRNLLTKTGSTENTQPPTLFTKNTTGAFDILFDGEKLTWVLVTNSLNTNTQSTSSPDASASSNKCTVSGNANQQTTNGQLTDQLIAEKYAVYPNPVTSNRLTVTSARQSLKSSDITIYDLQGKQYRITTTRQVSANIVELDISSLARGVYMVRLNTGSENKIFRIVKQ